MLSALYLSSSITKGALNANAGIRAEFNRLMLQGYYNASSPVNVDEPNLNVFPSVNIAYNITEKQILRLAYSGSINRPEFREIAPLTYYDFTEKNSVVGNPDLKDAIIQNLDLRYEIYPSPGETFTLAAFYKNFKNPIEMVSIGAGSLFSFDNADGAENFGLELELKKNLGFIGLKNFNLNLNTSFIYSQVLFEDQQSERNRALQGQSPYVVNAGIYYQNDEKGISSTLMYNVMGKRILVAAQINQGKVEVPDIYEMPRNVIDFSFNKKINSRMEIKFGIKDILSQNHRTMQNYEYISGGETKNILLTNRLYNTGRTWSLGINYKL
jgi:TonB-dependent receptor